MIRRIALAVLSMGAFVAADAGAAEAAVFRGDTSQGRAASVVIGSDGLLRAARVNWRSSCRDGAFKEKTIFLRPHDASSPEAFKDSGTYRRRDGRYRLRITTSIRGSRVSERRWRGRFSSKVLVTRGGRYVDTCRVRSLRWSARLVE